MNSQAYQDAVKKASAPLPSLPALTKYTNDQLFFMAFGQVQKTRFYPSTSVASTSSINQRYTVFALYPHTYYNGH